MTAIVGILNKQAVAVAADSAVTIGRGTKIYNTANKVFNLCKGRPVGIAIYGNAALNGCVPWEVVIKMYREFIGDQRFPKLSDYVDHFFDYVQDYTKRYISEEECKDIIRGNIVQFWCDEFTKGLREGDEVDAPVAQGALPILKKRMTSINARLNRAKVFDDYRGISLKAFVSAYEDVFDIIQNQISAHGGDWDEFKNLTYNILYRVFVTDALQNPYISGVAIFGYGNDEIYPSLFECQVYNIILSVQRICISSACIINQSLGAAIRPMAQRDVIETFIEGVSHRIKDTFLEATKETIKKTVDGIATIISKQDKDLADDISNSIDYDVINEEYRKTINSLIVKEQVSPLMSTIVSMGKEEIADLAENLIYMTSMKRHVTPFLETVGGPIDVAVISKGDGFIWIKRKHYFSADLNSSFFTTTR